MLQEFATVAHAYWTQFLVVRPRLLMAAAQLPKPQAGSPFRQPAAGQLPPHGWALASDIVEGQFPIKPARATCAPGGAHPSAECSPNCVTNLPTNVLSCAYLAACLTF
jgi:hypothetical protein